jgi:hypothetical protein
MRSLVNVLLEGQHYLADIGNAEETNLKDFRGGWFHMGDMMKRTSRRYSRLC